MLQDFRTNFFNGSVYVFKSIQLAKYTPLSLFPTFQKIFSHTYYVRAISFFTYNIKRIPSMVSHHHQFSVIAFDIHKITIGKFLRSHAYQLTNDIISEKRSNNQQKQYPSFYDYIVKKPFFTQSYNYNRRYTGYNANINFTNIFFKNLHNQKPFIQM